MPDLSTDTTTYGIFHGKYQRAFIKPVAELRFEPAIEAEYLFEAYCLDFEKDNPSESDRLSLRASAPEPVRKILAISSSDVQAIQLAVWAITDNISAHDAEAKFGATKSDINNARQIVQSAGLQVKRYKLFARSE